MAGATMKPEDFIEQYERALAAHSWDAVSPLVHSDVCVTFSDGSVHKGKAEVGRAFARNFAAIRDEQYAISDVSWVARTAEIAIFVFRFTWQGSVNGRHSAGSGRGTSVLINDGGRWKLLVEHLSKQAP